MLRVIFQNKNYVFLFIVLNFFSFKYVLAQSLSVTSDAVVITPTSTVSLSNQIVSSDVHISHSDTRDSGAGWNTTLTTSNLGINFNAMSTSSLSTFKRVFVGTGTGITSVTGIFNGLNCRSGYSGTGQISCGKLSIHIDIAAGGTPIQATVTLPDLSTVQLSLISNVLTLNGISILIDGGDSAVDDVYTLQLDSFPYTELTYTPANLVGIDGADTTSVTLGSSGVFAGSGVISDAKTVLIADVNFGLGAYTTDDSVSWNLHANSLAAPYAAVLTYTIS